MSKPLGPLSNLFRRRALALLTKHSIIQHGGGVSNAKLIEFVGKFLGIRPLSRKADAYRQLADIIGDIPLIKPPEKFPKGRALVPPSEGTLARLAYEEGMRELRGENFYEGKAWRIVRYQALKRASGCCQCCGTRPTAGKPLHVDHIKPRSKYPKLELDLSNLQVLCVDCNLGKGAWDETDWRENVVVFPGMKIMDP